jgi:hypothetical protein
MCTVVQEPVQVPDELPAGGEGVEQGGAAPVPGQHFPLRAPRVRQGRALNTFLPHRQNFGHFGRQFPLILTFNCFSQTSQRSPA